MELSFKYYILKHGGMTGENEKFTPGSVWRKSQYTGRIEKCVQLEQVDSPETLIACPERHFSLFTEISYEDGELLVAIKNATDRLAVFQSPDWLREGRQMVKGEQVEIVSLQGLREGTLGKIRYRGSLPSKYGVHLGVEIIEPAFRRKGTSDGTFKKVRYFQCEEDCGLFVALNKVRLKKEEIFSLSLTEDLGPSPQVSVAEASMESQNGVKMNDRVVWLSDDGPEFGTVLWMGVLPDDPLQESMVGVQFDHRVGSGTGKYKGKQLFTAKKGHASLVPVIGLLKAEEFLGSAPPPASLSAPFDSNQSLSSTASSQESGSSLGVNSRVLVKVGPPRYGVIRWIGPMPGSASADRSKLIAGVEMDVPDPKCYTDGTFCRQKIFDCEPHRAFFVHLHKCEPDDRAPSDLSGSSRSTFPIRQPLTSSSSVTRSDPPIRARREPVETTDSPEMDSFHQPRSGFSDRLVGKYRGIQGGHNSCYIDTVLMAMFAFSAQFDFLFQDSEAKPETKPIRKHLSNLVVQPLRRNFFVPFEEMMQFRGALDSIVPEEGFSTNMKDVEEFINHFFQYILRLPGFLQLSTNQDCYIYQLLGMPRFDGTPTVQQLMEHSLIESNVKIRNAPSKLLLQMPRFGATKVHETIFTNSVIDISDVLERFPRRCSLCSLFATKECISCFYNSTACIADCTLCDQCFAEEHSGSRIDHQSREIHGGSGGRPQREKYLLMSVVCIATSHYVCYLRCGREENATWILADSLAHISDSGVIPEVWACPAITQYLRAPGPREEDLTQNVSSFASDAYLCFYEKL